MSKDIDYENYGLDKFISLIRNGELTVSNKFSVIIHTPQNMRYNTLDTSLLSHKVKQEMILLCDTASVPGLSLMTNEVAVFGESRQMPTQRLYSTMSLSFYVDAEMVVRKYFDEWMESIINPVTRTSYYYDEYIANIEIYVHDKNFNVLYKVVLFECYPKALQNIDLDYSNNGLMKMLVDIQYKYYKVEKVLEEELIFQNFLATNVTQYNNSTNLTPNYINNIT